MVDLSMAMLVITRWYQHWVPKQLHGYATNHRAKDVVA